MIAVSTCDDIEQIYWVRECWNGLLNILTPNQPPLSRKPGVLPETRDFSQQGGCIFAR